MPKQKSDLLYSLVQSLTKSEKRHFKLYVNRLASNEDGLFVRLFDLLDQMDSYEEKVILKKLQDLKKRQLSNIKRHLFSQILKSLRLLYANKDQFVRLREQVDYAHILYSKGFYRQSLKMLDRLKQESQKLQDGLNTLHIIEFQKYIEERHITRSRRVKNRMENLLDASDIQRKVVSNTIRLTNLKLKIHGLYIKMGHIRDEKDHFVVKEYFQSSLSGIQTEQLSPRESIFLHQSYMWYYYILLDYNQCYIHAKAWLDLFDTYPEMIDRDPDLYMRGYSYTLSLLYYQKKKKPFYRHLKAFEEYSDRAMRDFNENSKIINFIYLYSAKINAAILRGDYHEGIKIVPYILKQLKKYQLQLDPHRNMVFNYKIAWLYFGAESYDRCIEHCNRIINQKHDYLRADLQCYARLLHLMAHYELHHTELLPYLIQSVKRFFIKMDDLNSVQKRLLHFLSKYRYITSKKEEKHAFMELQKDISVLYEHPYEKRAFQHLDIMFWIEKKIRQ